MRADLKSNRRDVYLLRGLPGAGKSTIAGALLKSVGYGEKAVYCSADDYFTDASGNYNYSREHIGDAHAACQTDFRNAIENQVELILVDNTHIRRRDFHDYSESAKKAGYAFYEITVGTLDVETSFTRNTHSVPLDTIKRMAERFER